jgi:hypothetical protein
MMKAFGPAALLLFAAGPAQANEARATLGVSVTIVSSCTVSTAARPQCTPGTSWTQKVDPPAPPQPSATPPVPGGGWITVTY